MRHLFLSLSPSEQALVTTYQDALRAGLFPRDSSLDTALRNNRALDKARQDLKAAGFAV